MKIEISDGEELSNAKHALMHAIACVNARMKDGIGGTHPERRPTHWWDNFAEDVKIARTLSALLDKLEGEKEKT